MEGECLMLDLFRRWQYFRLSFEWNDHWIDGYQKASHKICQGKGNLIHNSVVSVRTN